MEADLIWDLDFEAERRLSLAPFLENSVWGLIPSTNSACLILASASRSNLLMMAMRRASLGKTPVLMRNLLRLVESIALRPISSTSLKRTL